MKRIIGFLLDISQLVVAECVKEDDEYFVVKNPTLLGFSSSGNQINVQFIPLDVLAIQPRPVHLRNMLKDPTQELEYTFYKKNVLKYEVELADQVIENYNAFVLQQTTGIVTPNRTIDPPTKEVVNLFS